MKRKIRLTAMAAALVMLIAAAMPVYADTIIDYVLYTDIRTYIGGVEISSYNINGYTAVVVEDLANYGFDVVWNGSARTLTAKRAVGKAVTGSAVSSTSGGKVGDRAMPVYATDIKTYFDGVEFKSYNVGGKTIVYVDDLANMYSDNYQWNSNAKTLKVGLANSFTAPPVKLVDTNVLYDSTHLSIYKNTDANTIQLGSKTYNEGFVWGLTGNTFYFGTMDCYALFDLDKKYSKFSFSVGKIKSEQEIELQVFLDDIFYEKYTVSPNVPSTDIEIDLNYASSMKIVLAAKKSKYDNCIFGFVNCLLYP